MKIWYLLTSFNGRVDRKLFWLASMYMMGLQFLFFAVATLFVSVAFKLDQFAFKYIELLLELISTIPVFALLAKRLHDRDRPAYLVGLPLFPTLLSAFSIHVGLFDEVPHVIMTTGFMTAGISLWLLIELGFLRGTVGPNQYGPDPLAVKESACRRGGASSAAATGLQW